MEVEREQDDGDEPEDPAEEREREREEQRHHQLERVVPRHRVVRDALAHVVGHVVVPARVGEVQPVRRPRLVGAESVRDDALHREQRLGRERTNHARR